jgi:3-isopropylmalate/(R)-2-methylmalate dehydratase small subunit
LLPIVLTEMEVDHLFNITLATPGLKLNVDLERQVVEVPGGESYRFEIETFRKECLLNGWDEIGLTMRHTDKIRAYEAARAAKEPWLFGV